MVGFGRNLVEMNPSTLPDLSKQLRALENEQKMLAKHIILVITRSPGVRFGRNLVEMNPSTFPDLSKQLRALENDQKTKKNEKEHSRQKIEKILRNPCINRFWVITRSQDLGFGRNLVDFFPRSLPDLSKQLRDQNKRKKYKQNEKEN